MKVKDRHFGVETHQESIYFKMVITTTCIETLGQWLQTQKELSLVRIMKPLMFCYMYNLVMYGGTLVAIVTNCGNNVTCPLYINYM